METFDSLYQRLLSYDLDNCDSVEFFSSTELKNNWVLKFIGMMMLERTVFQYHKYGGTEFQTLPWMRVRLANLFDLELNDSWCPEGVETVPFEFSDDYQDVDELYLKSVSVDASFDGEELNVPIDPMVKLEKIVTEIQFGTLPTEPKFREVHPEEVTGYDRVIANNDWSGLMKVVPDLEKSDESDVLYSGIKSIPATMDIFQNALNELLPRHHEIDDKYFQDVVETSDIALELDNCSFDLSHFSRWDRRGGHDSSVSSGATSKRVSTFREVALAVKKRNMNVPQLNNVLDVDYISDIVVGKFFSSIVDINKLAKLPDVISQGEVGWFADYLKGKQVDESQFVDPIGLVSMDKYRHMIKSDLKPVEDNSLHSERPLPATITYHDKGKVMSTSPYFLAAMSRLLICLKEKIFIPTGKHHQLFSLDAQVFDNVKAWKEIDFSKFDKSQQILHHEIQRKVFLKLGLPAEFVECWFTSHVQSHISDPSGLRFSTYFQRRTGDACTYLGNTIVTLAVLCHVYDLDNSNVMMVVASGDDSLIGSLSELPRDNEHLCSTLFNFEAKFPHNQPFICSKFLLTMPTVSGSRRVVAVPNPLKLLIKLGRKNLSEENFDDWYQSFCDVMHHFNDHNLISTVAAYCSYRYLRKPAMFLEAALCAMKNLFSNKTKVKRILFPTMDKRSRR